MRVGGLKLGLIVGYWQSSGPPADALDQIAAAEDLGFDSIWTSEAYGSDCFTPLAWWGSQTERVKLGTAITQISARTPASTAMTAITLDHLSGGRLILGLGVSGPQVVEGWYGQDYAKPLARTREYIDIVRRIIAREEPVEYVGEHYAMPLQGGTGLGKPLKSIVRPLRTDIPIYLGAEGPEERRPGGRDRRRLAADVLLAQGRRVLPRGAGRGVRPPGARHTADDFEVACVVPVVPGDDVEACADLLRPNLALYIGGMGARDRNFHKDVFERLGYGAECEKIQDAYLDGRKADAAAAVPTKMVEDVYLVGPPEKIRDDLERLARDVHHVAARGRAPAAARADRRHRQRLTGGGVSRADAGASPARRRPNSTRYRGEEQQGVPRCSRARRRPRVPSTARRRASSPRRSPARSPT